MSAAVQEGVAVQYAQTFTNVHVGKPFQSNVSTLTDNVSAGELTAAKFNLIVLKSSQFNTTGKKTLVAVMVQKSNEESTSVVPD
jgi:hypothetical protein